MCPMCRLEPTYMDGQQSLMRLSCQVLLYCAFLLPGCQDHKMATVTSAAALQAQWQQLAVSTDQELCSCLTTKAKAEL